MMSFVERRQIYLNSNGGDNKEKEESRKRNSDVDSTGTIDREMKPNIRKFNLASAEKGEFAGDLARTDALTTPRQLFAL